jgi:hypothetical protein
LSDKEWIDCYPLFLLQEQVDFFCMEGTTISDLLINEQIRDKEVRVIGEEGEQLGIMSVKEAMAWLKKQAWI